jgi:putative heme transporter
MPRSGSDRRLTIDIPWRTIFRVIAAVALVWLWLQLYELVLVLAVAVMLAVALDPVVKRVQQWGLSRWAASIAVSLLIALAIGGFLWASWASLAEQTTYFGQHFDRLLDRAVQGMPNWMRAAVLPNPDGTGSTGGSEQSSMVARYGWPVVRSASYAITVAVLGYVVTVYLLIEGPATRDWLLAFVPKQHRPKAERTLSESRTVIFGYVAGNLITSFCITVFFFILLTALHVPAALLLALLTGLFDIIPVVGSILPAIPTILLAMTVSSTAAIVVAVAHVLYNVVENYLIAPWAYGGRLKLSSLAVILALVIGGEVAGVIGALIALPLAAVYPSVERIWLRSAVGEDTVREHRAIEHRDE